MKVNFCINCGAQLEDNANYCTMCGASIELMEDINDLPIESIEDAPQIVKQIDHLAFCYIEFSNGDILIRNKISNNLLDGNNGSIIG